MAITTLDGALAGMQPPVEFAKALTGTLVAGRPHSLLYTAGIPGAGVAPSIGIGGTTLTTYAGQLPFTNPGSGNTYLARFQAQCTQAGTLLLCDRLWHNSGIDVTNTSEQTFTSSVQIPARDANGTNNGVGVYAGVEVSSATGAGTPTITIKYTNSDATSNQTAINVVSTVASSIAGTFYPIGLAAGDKGIQKAQSITLSATWTSGTIHVVLYRVIARLEVPAQAGSAIDSLTSGFTQMYNDSVPFLVFIPNTTTTSNVNGQVIWTQG
ncbi:MAG: hypothetical protein KBC17_02115 [Candidatus Pacebacteria bacterium]|nr:hypothetical protein [Candidatus Paceibacterota bacterium]